MAKRGRPVLKAGTAKDEKLVVRFTRDEMQVFAAAANAAGQSISDWARDSVRKTLGTVKHHQVNVWSFSQAGETLRVETPGAMSEAMWLLLKRYVDEVLRNRP